jgi:hypothetical protein
MSQARALWSLRKIVLDGKACHKLLKRFAFQRGRKKIYNDKFSTLKGL